MGRMILNNACIESNSECREKGKSYGGVATYLHSHVNFPENYEKSRQDVKARDIEEYKMRKLPTHQWGYVVITTPEGVMDHEEAVTRNVSGQVLGYFH